MKKYLVGLLVCLTLSVHSVAAAEQPQGGLKIAPLEYRTTLPKGGAQKGYIDISNPRSAKITVTTSVAGFRQVSDNGALEFFTDPRLESGVKRDFDTFTLGPRQALRMYFILDGTKLPPGDVYAAIFFQTAAPSSEGAAQTVRLGTLLSIINGTPGERRAEITDAKAPLVQIGSRIKMSYTIRNTGDPKASTGFFPVVTLSRQPFFEAQPHTASLLFAGRTRTNQAEVAFQWPGVYRVRAEFASSKAERWVAVATPLQLGGIVGGILLLITVIVWWRRQRRAPRRKRRR